MIAELYARYKKLIVAAGIILLLVIGFLIYQSLQFRITDVTPNNRKYPASLGTMDITFNKKLDQSAIDKRLKERVEDVVSVNFEDGVTASVEGNTLRLMFVRTPMPGNYEISLKNITATNGDVINTKLPLVIKDIPYDKMSAEEKALYKQLASDGSADNISEHPLLAKLPYRTDKYQVAFFYDDETDLAPTLVITMNFFEPGDTALPATPAEKEAYLQDIRKYRSEALAWIRSQDPKFEENYLLQYTEPTLADEFPTGAD